MPNKDKTTFKRKFISLEVKIQILDRLQKGEKAAQIGRSLDLNEATIRTIRKNEKEIRSFVAAGSSTSAKHSARLRAPIIEKMEKALSIWINDCRQKRIPLSVNIIKQEGLKIYNDLKKQGESPAKPDFVASKGWFEKFKKRYDIQGKPASAGKTFSEELQDIITEEEYTTDQVFNAYETVLLWKKLPKTFLSKKEESVPGCEVSKGRLTLLLCSNASGDFMTKPLLVYSSELKNINKDTLPVYWKANSRPLVTADLFKDWFSNCFVPSVELYLTQKKLNFKALLLLDTAPCHPQDLTHPNVRIVFLPPKTASLLQPLHQGIIYTFKTYYIRRCLQWILNVTKSKSVGVMEAWKTFSMKNCIEIICSSLKDIKSSTLNAGWKEIWPSSVENVGETENETGAILEVAKSIGDGVVDVDGKDIEDLLVEEEVNVTDVEDILVQEEVDEGDSMEVASLDDGDCAVAKGFVDVVAKDIEDLLVEEEIDVVNVKDVEDLLVEEEVDEADSTEMKSPDAVKSLTLNKIQEGLSLAENLESFFLNADPSRERSQKFKRELENCLAPYREMYDNLLRTKKQRTT